MIFTSYSETKYQYNPADNSIIRLNIGESGKELEGLACVRLPYDTELLRTVCETGISTMIMELTESCNMRCRYCTYSGIFPEARTHGSQAITYQTAKMAVDWLNGHSKVAKKVCISFFGGEPLLHFNLLRRICRYAEKTIGKDRCVFEISTNATLLDETVARWVKRQGNTLLHVTLNGPDFIHDRLRRYADGRATHADIIANLDRLAAILGEHFRDIVKIQANYANMQEKAVLQRWFNARKEEVAIYPLSLPPDEKINNEIRQGSNASSDRVQLRILRREFVRKRQADTPVPELLIAPNSLLTRFRDRDCGKEMSAVYFPGVCSPFLTRVFVDMNGNIKLCERKSAMMSFGDIFDGIDWDRVNTVIHQINDYLQNELICRTCVAVRFCRLCFTSFLTRNGVAEITELRAACGAMRRHWLDELQFYVSLEESYK